MEPRTALTVALVAAGLAVGLVSADLYYSLTATLETRQDGSWEAVSKDRMRYIEPPSPTGCATPEMRLVVHNHVPFGQEVTVELTYWNRSAQRTEVVLRDTWEMDAGEKRDHAFTIPEAAFEDPEDSQGENRSRLADGREVHVNARVGDDTWLSACVVQEASS